MIERREVLQTIAASIGIGIGVTSAQDRTMADTTDSKGNFVTTDGSQLTVNGSRFRFNGTNNYWIVATHTEQSQVDELFAQADELGLNTVRTWGFCEGQNGRCFQPEPGVYDDEAFERLDYVIQQADEHGIRLIIPFVDNWDWDGGMNQYVEWSDTATDHDHFYTDETCQQLFREYIEYFLEWENTLTGVAYKNDPTILAWELANEPQAASDPSGETMQTWIEDTAAFVKSLDSNHLLSTGLEGFYGNDETYEMSYDRGTDYIANHQIEEIDLCSFHLYPYHWGLSEDQSRQWIRDHIQDARGRIGKPVYLGEFGWYVDRDADDLETQLSERNRVYTDWYSELIAEGVDGVAVWHLTTSSYTPDWSDGFDIRPQDTKTRALIEEYTQQLTETEEESADEKPTITIESFIGWENSSPNPHAELYTKWRVKDAGDALQSLTITITRTSDEYKEAYETRSVNGREDKGEWSHRIRHGAGEKYNITLQIQTSDRRIALERISIST